MIAVLDTSVVLAGIFFRADSYRCLVAFARRQYQLAMTNDIFEEYRQACAEFKQRTGRHEKPELVLDWLYGKAWMVDPVVLAGKLSRDPTDNKFVECALACAADYVVSRDRDLLALEKPFGIAIVNDTQFLRRLREREKANHRQRRRGR